MTDFAAVQAINAGSAVTERSGATAGTDTVPAGCTLLLRNTGAGTHLINLKCNQGTDGLTTTDRVISMATLTIQAVFVPFTYGDTNGRVGIAVDGTSAEVKYYVLAGT
jgi:hypothetical protein